MPGSGEGWPHGSQDLEGCGLTLEAHGLAASAAAPAVDSELLHTQSPRSAVPCKTREGDGPRAGQPGVLGYHSLPGLLVEPRLHAELASILPHLVVLWYLASFCPRCPQTGRMEVYLHVVSAAGAGREGGAAAGTAPSGTASWLRL